MKRFVAALLLLTMVLALANTALAGTSVAGSDLPACKIKAGMYVEFKRDSTAYTAPRASKKTGSVVRRKDSYAKCEKICGKYAKLLVNEKGMTYCWFKTADLKESAYKTVQVIWAKGGKGMSTSTQERYFVIQLKGLEIKVTGHTNLRKTPGLECKSQGIVNKGDKLKLTGNVGFDNRPLLWVEVCKNGKKLWISEPFACLSRKIHRYILKVMIR